LKTGATRLGKWIERHPLVFRRLDERVLGVGDRRMIRSRRELLGRIPCRSIRRLTTPSESSWS
jgi:hypothetical protein